MPLPHRNVTVSLIAHAGDFVSEPVTIRLVWGGPATPAPAPATVPSHAAAPPARDGGLVAPVGNAGVASAAERCLRPKDVFRDCENCPQMMVVPAGSFTMGSSRWEDGRDEDEGPQHDVTRYAKRRRQPGDRRFV